MDKLINELLIVQQRLVNLAPDKFTRNLQVNWEQRMIGIVGARGTGKTTYVLQHIKKEEKENRKLLYFSMDNPLSIKQGIFKIGKEFFESFGDSVIIDEVHKQNNWASDVKALYDMFPDKQIVILGSSKINILNQKGDLSRRILIYNLNGLSFREYLSLMTNNELPAYDFDVILKEHPAISRQVLKEVPDIKRHFLDYLQFGYYPFCKDNSKDEYLMLLSNILDKVIYEDAAMIKNIKRSSLVILKKLIAYLAISTIPTVNISSVCNELDVPKETLYEFFDLLNRTDLINIVRKRKSSVRSMKMARVLLLNPNLYYSIASDLWNHTPNIGNIRESFFVSQINKNLYSSTETDYELDIKGQTLHFEIGGKNKSRKQIKELENGYVFKDSIVHGYENVIPLYLAGFTY